jgi:hypothetical protein
LTLPIVCSTQARVANRVPNGPPVIGESNGAVVRWTGAGGAGDTSDSVAGATVGLQEQGGRSWFPLESLSLARSRAIVR